MVAIALDVHREGQHGRQLEVEFVESFARVLHVDAILFSLVIHFGQFRAVEVQRSFTGRVHGCQVEVVVVQRGQGGQRCRAVFQCQLGIVLYLVGQVEVEHAVVLCEGEVSRGDVFHRGLHLHRIVGGRQLQVGRARIRH